MSTSLQAEFLGIGDDAELMFCRALQLAKRTKTDGELNRNQTRTLHKRPENVIAKLLGSGHFIATETGYKIRGWAKWNKLNAQVEADLAKDRERKPKKGKPKKFQTESETIPPGFQVLEEKRREENIKTSPKTPKPPTPFQALQLALARDADGINCDDSGQGLNKGDWARIGKAAKLIFESEPTATPARVALLADRYGKANPSATLSASALASWWSRLAKEPVAAKRLSGFGVKTDADLGLGGRA